MNTSKEQHYAEEKGQLGFHALLQGNYDYAASMFSLAIEHLRAQATEEIYYALCLDGLGQARIGQQLFAEAEVPLRQALSLYEEKFWRIRLVDFLFCAISDRPTANRS